MPQHDSMPSATSRHRQTSFKPSPPLYSILRRTAVPYFINFAGFTIASFGTAQQANFVADTLAGASAGGFPSGGVCAARLC